MKCFCYCCCCCCCCCTPAACIVPYTYVYAVDRNIFSPPTLLSSPLLFLISISISICGSCGRCGWIWFLQRPVSSCCAAVVCLSACLPAYLPAMPALKIPAGSYIPCGWLGGEWVSYLCKCTSFPGNFRMMHIYFFLFYLSTCVRVCMCLLLLIFPNVSRLYLCLPTYLLAYLPVFLYVCFGMALVCLGGRLFVFCFLSFDRAGRLFVCFFGT